MRFKTSFGRPLLVTTALRVLGLPSEDTAILIEWEGKLLHGKSREERKEAALPITGYLRDVIAERRRRPTDDLISYAVASKIDSTGRLHSTRSLVSMPSCGRDP